MTKQDLLKVLDMSSEAEQAVWCEDHADRQWDESLADLAFRLRDEAVNISNNSWGAAILEVAKYKWDKSFAESIKGESECEQSIRSGYQILGRGKPIEIIIAALIAKET